MWCMGRGCCCFSVCAWPVCGLCWPCLFRACSLELLMLCMGVGRSSTHDFVWSPGRALLYMGIPAAEVSCPVLSCHACVCMHEKRTAVPTQEHSVRVQVGGGPVVMFPDVGAPCALAMIVYRNNGACMQTYGDGCCRLGIKLSSLANKPRESAPTCSRV